MPSKNTDLLNDVANYYSDKLALHGDTPRGVDWNGQKSQIQRFEQLCKIITCSGTFSLNDLGCGYGALYEFLASRHSDFSYVGVDVSADMIRTAEQRHLGNSMARFITAAEPDTPADYGIASGIFNVRLGCSDAEWHDHIESTLELLNRTSRQGFAFNCLTSYSDADKMRDYLYYADPCRLFDICKRRYSRSVALIHDYDLYEFTVLVRKHP